MGGAKGMARLWWGVSRLQGNGSGVSREGGSRCPAGGGNPDNSILPALGSRGGAPASLISPVQEERSQQDEAILMKQQGCQRPKGINFPGEREASGWEGDVELGARCLGSLPRSA